MSLLFPARVLPKAAILIGAALILGAAGMGVAHFVYGQPVYDRNTHRPASTGSVALMMVLLGSAGCGLSGLGVAVSRAARRHHGDEGNR